METAVPIQPVEATAKVDDELLKNSRRSFPWFLSTSNFLFVTASVLYMWMAVEDFKWSNELKDFPVNVRVATDDATWEEYRVQEWQKIVGNIAANIENEETTVEAETEFGDVSNVIGEETQDEDADDGAAKSHTSRDPSVFYDFWWADLPLEVQEAYEVLGYDENTWNSGGVVAVEDMFWSEMTLDQQNAATFLGYTQEVWNGTDANDEESAPKDPSIYYDFWWVDLPVEIQEAYGVLGYNETIWNNGLPVPVEDMFWSEMTSQQQTAATFLGYSQRVWDGVENEDVVAESQDVSNVDYDSYSWDDLPPEIQDAAIVLGYDQSMWNGAGTPETEDLWWKELSEEQQNAAAVFGYDQYSWDGVEVIPGDLSKNTNTAAAVLDSFYEFSLWDDDYLFQVAGTDEWVSKYQIVYFVAAMLFVFVGLLDVIRERKLFHVLMIIAGLNGVMSAVFVESDVHLSNIFSSISVHFFLLEGFLITFHHFVRSSNSTSVKATQLVFLKLLTFADILFVIGAFLDVVLSYFWLLDDTSDWDSALNAVGIFAAASWLLCPMIYLGLTWFDYFAFRDEYPQYTEDIHTIEEIHSVDEDA